MAQTVPVISESAEYTMFCQNAIVRLSALVIVFGALLIFSGSLWSQEESDEMPLEVRRYIQSVEQIVSLEYSAKYLSYVKDAVHEIPDWIPREGPCLTTETAEVKYEFPTHNYIGKIVQNPVGDTAGPLYSSVSYCNGVNRGYIDDKSPLIMLDDNMSGGDGYIGEVTDSEERSEFHGPERAMGFRFASSLGAGLESLPVLLSKCKSFERTGKSVIALDILGWESDSERYDVELVFGGDNGDQLVSIKTHYFNGQSGQRELHAEIIVEDFQTIDGFDIPTKFVSRTKNLPDLIVEADPDSIRVNREIADSEFVLKFPKYMTYYDSRTNKRMRDGVEVGGRR